MQSVWQAYITTVSMINGHSSDVDYKSISYVVCQYIFDYVPP